MNGIKTKALSLVLIMAVSPGALGADSIGSKYNDELNQIPVHPSKPPALIVRQAPEIPHCERYVTYRGKRFECDSELGMDAERLRPIVKDVPAALAELDSYQRTRRQVRYAGYVGTLGVVSIIVGASLSKSAVDPQTGALNAGAYLTIGGIIVAANALIYGLSIAKANKSHIGRAIDAYNLAQPNDQVVPQFDTRVHF